MTDHLDERQMYEIATGEVPDSGAEQHLAACEACHASVADTRRIVAALERLDPGTEAPAALDEGALVRRLERPGRASGAHGWMRRAAIGLLLFAGGAATHAVWTTGSDFETVTSVDASPTVALQRAGTDYVAAIARLVADTSRLSAEELRTGQEVALAAMSGAAYELSVLSGGDSMAREVFLVVNGAWTESARRRGS